MIAKLLILVALAAGLVGLLGAAWHQLERMANPH